MRCVGADQPPCVRCRKAHRECIVAGGSRISDLRDTQPDSHPRSDACEVGDQLLGVDSSQYPSLCNLQQRLPRSPDLTAAPHGDSRGRWHVDSSAHGHHPYRLPVTNLPSIYSTPPLQLIAVPGLGGKQASPAHLTTSHSPSAQIIPTEAARSPTRSKGIQDRELAHLAELYALSPSSIYLLTSSIFFVVLIGVY